MSPTLSATYCKPEQEKHHAYEERVCEVEHGCFTPLVFRWNREATTVSYKSLANLWPPMIMFLTLQLWVGYVVRYESFITKVGIYITCVLIFQLVAVFFCDLLWSLCLLKLLNVLYTRNIYYYLSTAGV